MSTETLIQRQIELEQESITNGTKHYFDTVECLKSNNLETLTRPVQQFIKRNLKNIAKALEISHEAAVEKKVGKRRSTVVLKRIKLLDNIPFESLALHTLMSVMDVVSKSDIKVTKAAVAIANSIIQEINFFRFKEENLQSFEITQQHIKKATSQHKRLQIMRRMYQKSNITELSWSQKDKVQIGTFLLDTLVEATGLWEIKMIVKSKKRQLILNPTEKLQDWLAKGHELCSTLQPKRLPMLVPPVQWTSETGGGYLTLYNGTKGIINSSNKTEMINDLDSLDIDNVLESVNAIQDTPWQVNTKVLNIAKECWHRNIQVGSSGKVSLPTQSLVTPPEYPKEWTGKSQEWREVDFDGYKYWATQATAAHEKNSSNASKRLATLIKFNIADKFKDEEAIYFPHSLDFRGRVYPLSSVLTPQGDDLSKSLLQFAEGKPLGDTGLRWLHIHTANCFGIDKVSFEERIDWTLEHIDDLLDSALDPMGGKCFWMEADDPFQALAVCFELLQHSILGDSFKSHLSIPQDGSCNGLQNFSALLKDPIGGSATNLVPADKPSDIYTEVLQLVEARVHQDALAGHTYAILLDGHLSRSIVKQPVMTLPYGATVRGMAKQIGEAIKKYQANLIPTKDSWATCFYLAQVTYDCIGNVVIAARSAMDYLQEMAKVIAKSGLPIRWTTPVGMPVVQDYRKSNDKRIDVFIKGTATRLTIQEGTNVLNKLKQKAGIAPNFIHSLDSSHLMLTVLLAKEQGISSFSMIHDSYGVHACDTDILHACLRTAFIEMYDNDILQQWTEEVKSQLDEETIGKLPEMPEHGTLRLDSVLNSQYFFA